MTSSMNQTSQRISSSAPFTTLLTLRSLFASEDRSIQAAANSTSSLELPVKRNPDVILVNQGLRWRDQWRTSVVVEARAAMKKMKLTLKKDAPLSLTFLLKTGIEVTAAMKRVKSNVRLRLLMMALSLQRWLRRKKRSRMLWRLKNLLVSEVFVITLFGSLLTYVFLKDTNDHDQRQEKEKKKRVAIVGSGIAGSGAAWCLNKSDIDVVMYEKKPKFGGNAKSYTWNFPVTSSSGVEKEVNLSTSLAVCAWPHQVFHNYNCLVESLGIATEQHKLRFFIAESKEQSDTSTKVLFAHDNEACAENPVPVESMPQWVIEDLVRWDKLVRFVRTVNAYLQPSGYPSLYRMNVLNPLNVIPLKLLCRMFGISARFWDYIFVAVHTSTFLELNLDSLPAVMAETLEDIMPLNATPTMSAWSTDAADPINRIVSSLPKGSARRSCAVEKVYYREKIAGGGSQQLVTEVVVIDEDGGEDVFDSIIFACSARAMTAILHTDNDQNGLSSSLMNTLEATVFQRTVYSHDRDPTFEQGLVHKHASVLPTKHRRRLLDDYCNYIEVDRDDPTKLENTFILSSWSPSIQHSEDEDALRLFKEDDKVGCFVTYNGRQKLDNKEVEWISTSREAHPSLTMWHLFASQMLWPKLQGTRNGTTFFCGSAVTPGNGHDLSFLSGLIAATELGARYPFPRNEHAPKDFQQLRRMMLPYSRI